MEQQDQQSPGSGNQPGAGRWIIILVIGIFLLYLAQRAGCGPVQTEEKMEWYR